MQRSKPSKRTSATMLTSSDATTTRARARGRKPRKLSQINAAELIASCMAEGMSLRTIFMQKKLVDRLPDRRTFYRWLAANAEVAKLFDVGLMLRAEFYAEEIVAIADDGLNDTYYDEEKGRIVVDFDNIQRSKLRVQARQWIAARMLSKKYGDRVTSEISGPDSGPIAVKNDNAPVALEALDVFEARLAALIGVPLETQISSSASPKPHDT